MQVKDMDEDEDDGLDECSFLCTLRGIAVTNWILLGICAADYSGGAAPYLHDEHTPGIITDDVSYLEQLRISPPISSF
jgi:hypothetical protein